MRWSVVAAVLLVVFAPSVPAAGAHPFGEPQRVQLSAAGSTVTVRWSAPADDLLLLGGLVGALTERRSIAFDVGPGASPEPVGETDADRLIASDEVAAYLAERVSVRQQGVSCPVDVQLAELVGDGAQLVFDCPRAVESVEIGVSTLTDVNAAYRIVALGDGTTSPDRSLYTAEHAVMTWTFGAEPASGGSGTTVWQWLVAGLAGASVVAALAIHTYRRRNRADAR
ncbi:hypothetical protein ABZ863_30615 [Saccharomonospora sp. NPDC046836]|uniref:hypothetical protein n=1 Tax=Saccharomonospora sp. NPDC046836 TaxID=3156921 RepID=UPI0033CFE681